MTTQNYCYKITLKTTNGANTTAEANRRVAGCSQYITVREGTCYTIAPSMAEAGLLFPNALCIQEMGLAYIGG